MSGDGAPGGSGQSSVLGTVLLLGIVLTVSVAVILAGSSVLEQSQTRTSFEGAAVAMGEIDSQIESLRGEGGESASVSIATLAEHGDVTVRETGSMQIVVNDTRTAGVEFSRTERLGAIVFEHDGETVAYQGGGVWRSSGEASVVVSPPTVEYSAGSGHATLTVPLVRVVGNASGDALGMKLVEKPERLFPVNASATNPLEDDHEVTLTVESEYYRAWGAFFEDRTNGTVRYDHGSTQASVTLQGSSLGGGGTGPGTAGDLSAAIETTDIDALHVDNDASTGSYDSRDASPSFSGTSGDVYISGRYAPSEQNSEIGGDLIAENASFFDNIDGTAPQIIAGDAIVGGTPGGANVTKVHGYHDIGGRLSTTGDLSVLGDTPGGLVSLGDDVYVGGDVLRFENVEVNGDVYVQGDLESIGPTVTVNGKVVVNGTINDTGGPTVVVSGGIQNGNPPDPIEPTFPSHTSQASLIDYKRDQLAANNDNASASGTIADINGWDQCSPCTLPAGDYYFEDGFVVGKEEVIIDARNGSVEIFAESGPNGGLLVSNGNLTILGDNPVRFYTDGDVEVHETDGIGEQSQVVTRPDPYRAPNFQVYMLPTATAKLNNHDPIFTGVLYGPGEPDGTAITVTNDATVYGAIVGELEYFNENATIYYDEALESFPDHGSTTTTTTSNRSSVSFLHLTTSTVEIEE